MTFPQTINQVRVFKDGPGRITYPPILRRGPGRRRRGPGGERIVTLPIERAPQQPIASPTPIANAAQVTRL